MNNQEKPTYEEQISFFKKIGFVATGYDGIWSDGTNKFHIEFFGSRTEIRPVDDKTFEEKLIKCLKDLIK